MELDAESIRTLNRLPPHAKHCLRYRASQLTVMREVEMRLSPPDPDEKTLRIFQDEGRELSLLDAPWFLPVLEAGTFRDRPFYLVPLRRYPSLAEAIEDPRFGRQERFWAVRHLAGMMATLHDAHGALGPPYMDLLAWNWDENQLVCLHHKHLARPQPDWLRGALPEDMQSGSKWSARTDLFLWGCFAYWLLSDGAAPYPATRGGDLRPIHDLLPELAGPLAEAIEACLAWEIDERPRDAVELRSVLQQSPANEREAEPAPAAEDPMAFARQPSTLAFKARVDTLRDQGRVPDTSDQSLVQSFVAVGRMTADQLRRTQEDGSGGWILGGIAAVVALVLGSTLAPYLGVGPPPRVVAPLRPVATREASPAPPPPTTQVLLAPSKQAELMREPLIASLLGQPAVTPESFDRTWKLARTVVLAQKLPQGLLDGAALVELRRRKALDAPGAAAALQEHLVRIRATLGETPPGP